MTTNKQLREEWPIVLWAVATMVLMAVVIAATSFFSSWWLARTMQSQQVPTHYSDAEQHDNRPNDESADKHR